MDKHELILAIKDAIDAVFGCDCAYYSVDGFAIAESIYEKVILNLDNYKLS